ncbi:MAG: hypothetical protein J6S75_13000, partial [Thermoguttaceae bacterium]|nr:hypothetical protein [Thermoguttaceae bacterium]
MRNRQSISRFGLLPIKMVPAAGAAIMLVCAVFSFVPRPTGAQEDPEQLTSPAAVTQDLLNLLPDDSSQAGGIVSSPEVSSPGFAAAAENSAPQGAAADVSDSDTPFERIAPQRQPACAAMTAKESPWCRFRPGSWSRTRTVSVS